MDTTLSALYLSADGRSSQKLASVSSSVLPYNVFWLCFSHNIEPCFSVEFEFCFLKVKNPAEVLQKLSASLISGSRSSESLELVSDPEVTPATRCRIEERGRPEGLTRTFNSSAN